MATTGPDGVSSGRSRGVYNIKEDDKKKKDQNNQQVQNLTNTTPVTVNVQTGDKSNNKSKSSGNNSSAAVDASRYQIIECKK